RGAVVRAAVALAGRASGRGDSGLRVAPARGLSRARLRLGVPVNRRAFLRGASQGIPRWLWPALKPKEPVYEVTACPFDCYFNDVFRYYNNSPRYGAQINNVGYGGGRAAG